MVKDLVGKTALVTGAGKRTGIGFAIARKLASLGTRVILADLGNMPQESSEVRTGTLEEMEELARELQKEFDLPTLAVPVDVSKNEAIQAMVETIKGRSPISISFAIMPGPPSASPIPSSTMRNGPG